MLLCLQALDAGGKDGTIRHVMSGVNPQGVRVSSFKVPSAGELDHDYLWRYARRLPARGEIGIFNRSHYEEVLVVRVHPEALARQRLPETGADGDIWDRRYREINDWERYLVDNGFAVVKLFLNLSKEEQRTRFLKRIDVPERNWKFSAADVRERRRWDDYQDAFSQMLSATSTECAPWYVVPADRKWFARICAGAVLAHTLIELDPQYPVVGDDGPARPAEARRELEAEAPDGAAPDPYAAKHDGSPAHGANGKQRRARQARRAAAKPPRPGAGPDGMAGREHGARSAHRGRPPRRRRPATPWYAQSPAEVAHAAGGRPGRRAAGGRGRRTAARGRPQRAARGAAEAGLAALPRGVPQLHADHPGRRGRGVRCSSRSGAPPCCCCC